MIWHYSTETNIDETQPLLIIINTGDIKKARFIKHENLFRCSDDSVAFPEDIIKFLYIKDLI
jgi:hypothetical protein